VLEQIIIVIHVLIALAIVALILLQQGKGADMGASFGGGGSQTLFGPSGGGNLLTQLTAIFSVIFFVTSFSLAVIAKQKAGIGVEPMLLEPEVPELIAPAAVNDDPLNGLDELPSFEEGVASPDAISNEDVLDNIPE
jgi:preprotein translocase subunit SecG